MIPWDVQHSLQTQNHVPYAALSCQKLHVWRMPGGWLCFQIIILITNLVICLILFLCCREVKLKQRQNHEKLASSKNTSLFPGCRYFLLPSSWLKTWKNFVNASGKSSSSAIEPEALDGVIDSLKCEKVKCPPSNW